MRGWSFSWNRFLGITKVKQSFAKRTGIPTTRGGIERKVGNLFFKLIKSLFKF